MAATLSACGGGGGGGGGVPASWVTVSVAHTFDSAAAETIRISPEFQNVDRDITIGGTTYRAHPYELIRLHIARSGGLSGNGMLVAVVDDGFRVSHEVFTGKTIVAYGDISVIPGAYGDHGTHVASLIAANESTGDIMGVAPNASLHLTSYLDNSKSAMDLSKIRLATLDARSRQAVAQNNSWGVLRTGGGELLLADVQAHIGGSSGTTAAIASAFNHFSGGGAAAWQQYFTALDAFQDRGVVVWALSNNSALSDADASGALPVLLPYLQDAWIAVGNGAFNLNANLQITAARRISAPCGQAATFCLFADGTTVAAESLADDDYWYGTGTSYAAPQVSGAIALVAEAFPNLSPNEWQKRLLASAYSNFAGFNATGTHNFGNGVAKSYSNEWGMGVLDVAAALSPIGTVSLLNGRSVQAAERHDLDGSFLRGNAAFGDGLSRLMTGNDLAVFDALNGDFYIDAGTFAPTAKSSTRESAALPRIGIFNERATNGLAAFGFDETSQELHFEDLGYTFGFSVLDGHTYLQNALGLGSENVNNASVLGLATSTTAAYGRYDMGFAKFEHYGFAGAHASDPNGAMVGAGAALAFDFDALDVRIGVSQSAEQGAFLGMTGSGPFSTPESSALSAFTLATSLDITPQLALFGGLEYGVAFGTAGSGYATAIDPVGFSGFQVGLRASDVFASDDRLTFTLSQPLRAESGTISMDIPVGRSRDGTLNYQTVSGEVAPSGRQLDLGLSYLFRPSLAAELEMGFVYSIDAGHRAGNEAAAIAAAYKRKF
ncbi:S8 family peptidase [Pelagibacterium limicola]|uniref:S8 family peptidase n=1 Tax=Pelagibacterium limicola TaxID=2791022 RepID=UPI0018AFB761|nr:S8 family peptidase [Pelagibacterium limicola]